MPYPDNTGAIPVKDRQSYGFDGHPFSLSTITDENVVATKFSSKIQSEQNNTLLFNNVIK
jgi:hypothetical protein